MSGRSSSLGLEARIGLDRIGIDAAGLGDSLDHGVQFHRLQEGDESKGVELIYGSSCERALAISGIVQRQQEL